MNQHEPNTTGAYGTCPTSSERRGLIGFGTVLVTLWALTGISCREATAKERLAEELLAPRVAVLQEMSDIERELLRDWRHGGNSDEERLHYRVRYHVLMKESAKWTPEGEYASSLKLYDETRRRCQHAQFAAALFGHLAILGTLMIPIGLGLEYLDRPR